MRHFASIRAIAYHLPEDVLSNDRLASEFPDWPADKILAKTGIAERHIARAGECSSDLAVKAAAKLFASQVIEPGAIDFMILCTQSPDYWLPTTACLVQDRLNLPTSAGAFDLNQGCSGFVYAAAAARGLIESEAAKNVLVLTAETYSKFLDPADRGTRAIFGDGAAAVLMTATTSQPQLGPFVFGTDGSGADRLVVRAGGMRHPLQASVPGRLEQRLEMDGPGVFAFTLEAVPGAVDRLLSAAGLSAGDVDYFVFHQASHMMLDHLRRKMKIPAERFCIDLEATGNTVSSTIPIALHAALKDGRVKAGDLVALVGFGVGLSWAAALLRVDDIRPVN